MISPLEPIAIMLTFIMGYLFAKDFYLKDVVTILRGTRIEHYVHEHNVITKVFYKNNLVQDWKDNLLNTSAEEIKLRREEAKKLLTETKNKFKK